MARMRLKVAERSELGTRKVHYLRSDGVIPGVVYGKGKKNELVKVSMKEVNKVKGGHIAENVVMDLVIGDSKSQDERTVIVKEIQKDVIKGEWLHIDFNEISLKEKLRTTVPIHVQGDAKGVVTGGTLDQIMHEIEVECLPTDIPEHIPIDVSSLEIGDALYVKDLTAPEKVTILTDKAKPVVSVAAPRAEEETVAAAPAEGEEGAEPEVISKGKKEKEGEEAEEAEETGAKPKAEKKPKEETKKEEGKSK